MPFPAKSLAVRLLFNLLVVISLLCSQIPPAVQASALQTTLQASPSNQARVTNFTPAAQPEASSRLNGCIFKYCIYFPVVNNAGKPSTITGPDLSLTLTSDLDSVEAGAPLVYTLHYKNNGPVDATGIMLYEYLPESTTFRPTGSTAGWQQIGDSSEYGLAISALAAGASSSTTFAVTVADPVASIDDNAWITDSSSNYPDPNLANNSASLSTPIN